MAKIRDIKNSKLSDKQMKIDHLTEQQQKRFMKLKLELGGMIMKNSNIVRKDKRTADMPTKTEMRKGKNVNKGVEKIHSEAHLNDLLKFSNTFVKYCIEKHDIKQIRDIKPRMVEEFCRGKMENGDWSKRTLDTNISRLKKIGESVSNNGIQSFKRLVNGKTEKLKEEFKPEGTRRENRTRNRKANGDSLSVREARVIAKHIEKTRGVIGRCAVNTMAEADLRADELMKLKWKDVDFEKGTINLERENMTKGDRPRIVFTLSEKTLNDLKQFKDDKNIKNNEQTVFRSQLGSLDSLRRSVKQAAQAGKVAYLGLHAFRSASKEYQTKQLEKEKSKFKREYGTKWAFEYRKFLVERIEQHVSISEKLRKKDKDGNYIYDKERLMGMKITTLERDVLSQSFGHNRRSVLNEYGH